MQIFLLIEDDRQGPFTPEEITAKLQSGECTPETLAWMEGMEEWQSLRDVLPKPEGAPPPSIPVPPPLPEVPADNPSMLAGGGNAFLEFFRAYKGLFQRIKNSPLPQPAQWYDRYPIVFAAAFLAFFFYGLGLIPLWLTSRLSRGDKGRLSVIAAWPLCLAMLPAFVLLLVLLLLILPLAALVMMWVKRWFTPAVRYVVTAIMGLGFVCFIALLAIAAVKGSVSNGEPRFSTSKLTNKESGSSGSQREQGGRLTKEEKQAGLYLTQSGYLAAVSKEAMASAASFQIAGDSEALASLMESGQVIRLKAGVKVQLMETHVFSGLVEIRAFGTTGNLWTNVEAIGQ